MNIDIKKSIKPVKYNTAIKILENRLHGVNIKKNKELIWILEHDHIYTAGTSFKENEILNKSIEIIKTNRGGKITYHGPGQIICYFVIDLNKRNKDIRKFIRLIEKTIIETINEFGIKTFNDKRNIGIWYKDKTKIKKVAAIGLKVSKWIAYHGFAINIKNDLTKYKSIIPCGISDKEITNLKTIKNQNYDNLKDKLIINFSKNLEA
jgi:lipoyl(octanoyl) transferase